MAPASRNQAAHALEKFQEALVRDQIVTGVGLERALQHSRAAEIEHLRADDYILKPFEPTNLTSRITAAFRRQRLGA